jgi:hypothetical protein
VQQALTLQRGRLGYEAVPIYSQKASHANLVTTHAVQNIRLCTASSVIQGKLTCSWPASAYCEALSWAVEAASEAAPFAESYPAWACGMYDIR